jgi:hypothetical protein
MGNDLETFNIILRDGLPAREFAFLEKMCSHLTSPAGKDLLFLRCASIDTSHNVYVQAEVISKPGQGTYSIQLPHQFVLLISGSELPKTLGFTAS